MHRPPSISDSFTIELMQFQLVLNHIVFFRIIKSYMLKYIYFSPDGAVASVPHRDKMIDTRVALADPYMSDFM